MPSTCKALAALWLLSWSVVVVAAPLPHTSYGEVVYVNDGDTVVVAYADGGRDHVRIVSIDAPEKGRKGRPGQPYSEKSRRHLQGLIDGKTVRMVSPGRDDYGRLLARIWLDDVDIGLAQVCAGYAWVFEAFIEELLPVERQRYRSCQRAAERDQRGLWRGARPVPPWQWRYPNRATEKGR